MKHFLSSAAIGLFLLGALSGVGHAQSTNGTKPLKSGPVPKLDAEALKIPDSIHSTGARQLKVDKGKKTLAAPSLPNKFDLGTYDLEFKAGQTSDVNPRTGYDSGEKSNLSNTSVGRRPDSALPDYFGLKLSAPTE